MYAVRVHEFGGPEVLTYEEVPDPKPGPGQVVVAMAAADVGFLDTHLRGGWGQEIFPRELPYIPGGGGAGEVISVGEGVDPTWIGRRVAVSASTGYAEQIIAKVGELVAIPDEMEFEQAAAILHDGATAVSLIEDIGGIRRGEWVLIAAASGGAGSILVQMAHDAGARVIAAARGERKLALARERGAEITVDYSDPSWASQVQKATAGHGADLTFDGAGAPVGVQAFEATRDGGRFITYGTAEGFTEIDPAVAERRRITAQHPLAAGPPDETTARTLLERTVALAADGVVRPNIGATFPLKRAADAHQALAERTTLGKSLLIT